MCLLRATWDITLDSLYVMNTTRVSHSYEYSAVLKELERRNNIAKVSNMCVLSERGVFVLL